MSEKIREKRDLYRTNIRLSQNQRRFQERRKQLFNMLHQSNQQFIDNFMSHIQDKKYQSLINSLQNFHQTINQNTQTHKLPIINIQSFLANFIYINQIHHQNYSQQQKIDQIPLLVYHPHYSTQLIQLILNIFTKINFSTSINIEFVIDKLWIVFQSESSVKINCLLIIFNNILTQIQNSYKIFYNKGLPATIINLLNKNLKQYDHNIYNLIINFLSKEHPTQVTQITQFFNQDYKNYFFSLAMNQLQSNSSKIHFLKALEVIRILVENNKYICQFIDCKIMIEICHLINSKNLQICYGSLRIIDNLIYHSNSCLKSLLQSDLFKIIQIRLCIQQDLNDDYQKQRLKIIKYIISNSFLVSDVKIRKKIRNHSLMDKIFQSLTPTSKFYCLCSIFKFFFNCITSQLAPKYLDTYLKAISLIDLSNQSMLQTKQIKETICQLYYQSQQYWEQKYQKNLVNLLEKYRLKWIIDEID